MKQCSLTPKAGLPHLAHSDSCAVLRNTSTGASWAPGTLAFKRGDTEVNSYRQCPESMLEKVCISQVLQRNGTNRMDGWREAERQREREIEI